jgi:N-methylhydantoinase B
VVWKGKLARYPLKRGDVARMVTGVGGGYGDPARRDPGAVRQDVRNEFLSVEQAREIYGVVIDPQEFEIDEASSQVLPEGGEESGGQPEPAKRAC